MNDVTPDKIRVTLSESDRLTFTMQNQNESLLKIKGEQKADYFGFFYLVNKILTQKRRIMKRSIYIFLLLIVPFICVSQTLFRSGKFLHHSTGQNIWGPNGSSTSIPLQIELYNSNHGYTGINAVSLEEQQWPLHPWDNEWERWHRIFNNEDPEANILPILADNKIVVIKSCFPSSEMVGQGQPSDTLAFTTKSVYNYKWHWRNIVNVMAQHPENFFVIWTNAPHLATNTNPTAALSAKRFTTWAKDTLAMGLDPEFGDFPPNVYVFHYFSKLSDSNGYELPQYGIASDDSHPNALATEVVDVQFVNEIFDAAIAYEQGFTLSISPSVRNVSSAASTTTFAVTSNSGWTCQSNQNWCTVTPSGSGNGNMVVSYTANTSTQRTAIITVTVNGLSPLNVTLNQDGVAGKVLNISVLIEGLYNGNGTMRRANDELGPHFGTGIADLLTVELHNSANYNTIVYSSANVQLSTTGSAVINIPSNFNGNYYITVKHRNSMEITSASPVSFTPSVINYSYNLPSKVYGGKLMLMSDGYNVVFSGDVNQDGFVDTADMTPVDNDASNFVTGYLLSDINCDGVIDTADLSIIDNNTSGFISSSTP